MRRGNGGGRGRGGTGLFRLEGSRTGAAWVQVGLGWRSGAGAHPWHAVALGGAARARVARQRGEEDSRVRLCVSESGEGEGGAAARFGPSSADD